MHPLAAGGPGKGGRPAVVDAIPAIHLQSLRHTGAMLQLVAGVHPKIVQERLGHQTISITLDTYLQARTTNHATRSRHGPRQPDLRRMNQH